MIAAIVDVLPLVAAHVVLASAVTEVLARIAWCKSRLSNYLLLPTAGLLTACFFGAFMGRWHTSIRRHWQSMIVDPVHQLREVMGGAQLESGEWAALFVGILLGWLLPWLTGLAWLVACQPRQVTALNRDRRPVE